MYGGAGQRATPPWPIFGIRFSAYDLCHWVLLRYHYQATVRPGRKHPRRGCRNREERLPVRIPFVPAVALQAVSGPGEDAQVRCPLYDRADVKAPFAPQVRGEVLPINAVTRFKKYMLSQNPEGIRLKRDRLDCWNAFRVSLPDCLWQGEDALGYDGTT